MKLLIAVCLVAMAAASPPPSISYPTDNVEITKYENDNFEDGRYRYAFEQTDGTYQQQTGEIRNEGREDEYLAVSGSFSWIAPNGVRYTVTYKADEDGYQPKIEEGPGAGPPDYVASLLGK